MRTRLGAVENGTVGRERVLLLRPWRNRDLATHGGARGGDATAVLDELSQQPAPRAGTRDGKVGRRVRRDGVATDVDHRGHLLPRSDMGPLFGHGCSLRRLLAMGNWFFARFLSRMEPSALPLRRLLRVPGGGR